MYLIDCIKVLNSLIILDIWQNVGMENQLVNTCLTWSNHTIKALNTWIILHHVKRVWVTQTLFCCVAVSNVSSFYHGPLWLYLIYILRFFLPRFFIGTSVSTFSFRIHEEREILGFDPKTTYNRFCGDSEKKCEQPTHWKIVYWHYCRLSWYSSAKNS